MAEQIRIAVYVKAGCTLCEPVLQVAEKVGAEFECRLDKIDISTDPNLEERFGQEIPVVSVDDEVVFCGAVSEKDLGRCLKKRVQELEGESELVSSYVPPSVITVLVLVLTVAGAGWFVSKGFQDAGGGLHKMAALLLKVQEAKTAPEFFRLPKLEGGELGLDDLKDKVVFINFWATWCPPCVEEMPSLFRLQERLSETEGLKMVAISADEGWAPVRQFFKGDMPKFPVLLDKEGQLAQRYGTEKFPETYVVIDGKTVGYIVGPRNWDTWYAEAYLRGLVQHRDAS